jgi:NAD(P)-dependent dehydrogenase (short-subunit alcohol dehydrogenase family)
MTALFAKDAFAGKAVLITGATSGIGEGTAKAFADHGANVMINGRDTARGTAVRDAIRDAGGTAALSVGSVADAGYCDSLVAETVSTFGRLDVLFNNAGVVTHGPIDETSDADWQRVIDINVSGSFFMARAAVRQMKAQGEGGAIVNMGSECSLIAYERLPAYSATKGAIVMLTKCMAMDHARDGIRVNAVCPGDIDTPMMDIGWQHLDVSAEEIREKLKDHIPIGKVGLPLDIANAVMYLASDAAGFVTGTMLPIDGGTTAR